MTNFDSPCRLSVVDCVFGGSLERLLPPWDAIPEEYKSGNTEQNEIVSRWFFSGLPEGTRFVPKPGIDSALALAHLKSILVSFEPKHEHKEAGCAYLIAKWFDDVILPEN